MRLMKWWIHAVKIRICLFLAWCIGIRIEFCFWLPIGVHPTAGIAREAASSVEQGSRSLRLILRELSVTWRTILKFGMSFFLAGIRFSFRMQSSMRF